MATKYTCVNETCRKQVTATKNQRYRTHTDGNGDPCELSSAEIPEHVLANPVTDSDPPDVPQEGVDYAVCPQCERKVKLTRLGYFEPHDTTLKGGDRCPTGGVRAKHARRREDVPLPGDDLPKPGAESPAVRDSEPGQMAKARAALTAAPTAAPAAPTSGVPGDASKTTAGDSPTPSSGTSAGPPPATSGSPPPSSLSGEPGPEGVDWSDVPGAASSKDAPSTPSPASTTTSESSAEPEIEASPPGPYSLGITYSPVFLQPFSPFLQPGEIPPRVTLAEAMSDRGKELAARFKEIFYAYTNRNSSDNRSAQKTLGPSEAGSPCERQIAMKLLGIDPTNPQEGWAPFVGTAVHRELADMFEWANGSGSGRFVTEMRVEFGHPLVPRGTLDVLDRVLYMVDDHKLMGRYSLDKLIKHGPSETYRKQIQLYGRGAELAGEKVREVAIIAWPRQESSLDKLYVHVEPYDRKVAQEALDRVARIAEEVAARSGPGTPRNPIQVAQQFEPADDCKWCPFFLKGDKGFTRGCPGK